MIPNERFRFEAKPEGSKTRVLLKGIIDEDTEFEAMKKIGTPLIINFKALLQSTRAASVPG